ncbi:kinesin-like protein KIN-14P [Lactuca sativa]|uniref:kinesin-like protein KIN-14P n=1 Tax=Lactuca sativa TaxID=4236 RepID=UPI000CD8CA15|nr:kinesin-like protein KIN-14P [Lactuca sativa]
MAESGGVDNTTSTGEEVDFVCMVDEDDPTGRYDAAMWLRKRVGVVAARDLPAEPSEEDCRQGLRSGMILCNVLNKIQPGSVPKVVNAPSPVFTTPDSAALAAYLENIKNFLKAIETIGLPTFEPSDLEQGGYFSRVVNTVLAMRAYNDWKAKSGNASRKFSWSSPSGKFLRSKEPAKGGAGEYSTDQYDDGSDPGDESDLGPLFKIVSDLLMDREEEDIPIIVENILNKLKEEFEKRLAKETRKLNGEDDETNSDEDDLSAGESSSPDYEAVKEQERINREKEMLELLKEKARRQLEEEEEERAAKEQERINRERELLEQQEKARREEEERAAREKERIKREKERELLEQQEKARKQAEAEKAAELAGIERQKELLAAKAKAKEEKKAAKAKAKEEKKAAKEKAKEEKRAKKEQERMNKEQDKEKAKEEKKAAKEQERMNKEKEKEEAKKKREEDKAAKEKERAKREMEKEKAKKQAEANKAAKEQERIKREKELLALQEKAKQGEQLSLEREKELLALQEKARKEEERERIEEEKRAREEEERERQEEEERARLEEIERLEEEERLREKEERERQEEEERLREQEEKERLEEEERSRNEEEKERLEEEERKRKEVERAKQEEEEERLRKEEEERAEKEKERLEKEEELREQEERARQQEEYRKRMEQYNRLNANTTKRKGLIERQDKDLQELRSTISTAKTEVHSWKTACQEEAENLGGNVRTLCQAAAGYKKVLEENRKLYNQVQDLKGSIRVYCRIRPPLPGQENHPTSIDYTDEETVTVITPAKSGREGRKASMFNKVFGPSSTQEEVFSDTQPLIRSVLDGFNVCLFAYGPTSSGKTYTLTGPDNLDEETMGVNLRALNDLFLISEERKDLTSYTISINILEIYNDEIRDLLVTDGSNKIVEISSSKKGTNVPDANLVEVTSTDDVINQINLCKKNRAGNDRSSRAHSFLTVHVVGKDNTSGSIVRGCMHLVDLAGSEKLENSDDESTHISKSLSALGDTLVALATKAKTVPFKSCKLTQLLQDVLGAQAKILIFVHVHPDADEVGETLSTFKFIERFSTVEGGCGKSAETRELKEQVAYYKAALAKREAAGDLLPQEASVNSPRAGKESADAPAEEEPKAAAPKAAAPAKSASSPAAKKPAAAAAKPAAKTAAKPAPKKK